MSALSGVGVIHVTRTTDKELDLLLVVGNDVLGHVQNQVNAFLLSDTTNKGEQRHGIIQLSVVEVLHLEEFLRSDVVRSLLI